MDIKVTGNYSVYKNMVNSAKNLEKPVPDLKGQETRGRSDEIVISSDSLRRQEASQVASGLYTEMGRAAKNSRITELKQQIQSGEYQISAKTVADKILEGR